MPLNAENKDHEMHQGSYFRIMNYQISSFFNKTLIFNTKVRECVLKRLFCESKE